MPIPLGILAAAGVRPAAGGSYELIATAFGTGSSRLISFINISSQYEHLQLRGVVRSTNNSNTDFLALNINQVETASYSQHFLAGNSSTVSSGGFANQSYINISTLPAANAASGAHNAFVLDLLDYTNTSKNKTTRTLAGYHSTSERVVELLSGGFYNTNAITRLDIVTASGNFTTTSRLSLYGIRSS